MKSLPTIISLVFLSFVFTSCEKVIELDLPTGQQLVYADAWITDLPGTQTIKLLEAVNYQDQSQPRTVSDATVKLTDLTAGKSYNFVFNNGAYSYNPGAGTALGISGHQYALEIIYKGETFTATDKMTRALGIDSLSLRYKPGSGDFEKEGYYAEFHAKDLPGAVDYYWIRTYRNGVLNPNLYDMLSIDASFYPEVSDGFEFIPPFREGVTSGEKPYQKGDEVKVVMRTITQNSYEFLEQTMKQITNGGLFSEVLQNVPANITNRTPSGQLKIYGWFGTTAETAVSRKVQ